MTLEEEIRAAMVADLTELRTNRGEGALKPEECMVRAAYFEALALAGRAEKPDSGALEAHLAGTRLPTVRETELERVEKAFEQATGRMRKKR